MSQRTVTVDQIRSTAKEFQRASADFDAAVNRLKQVIGSYIAANKNEAAESVNQEWNEAQNNMAKVKLYLEEFGRGLDKQAQTFDEVFQNMKWK